MTIQTNIFRLVTLLAGMGLLAFATVTHAQTKTCPPPFGTPWGGNNLVQGINQTTDCWTGLSYETAIENMGRGKILVGASGGSAREVWAYNFNSGSGHDYVRVRGVTTDDDAEPYGETPGLTTCVAFDTTKNAQWGTPATGQGCIGTLYAYVEGWKY